MIISKVTAIPVSIPYDKPFTISGGANAAGDHVLVAVQTEEGITGYGESAPMVTYSGETQSDSLHALQEFLAESVQGVDPFDLESVHARMDAALPDHHFAKSAVDMALYDIMGKYLNVPAYKLMGGLVREHVDIAWVVGIGTVEEMVQEAVAYSERGFETIKVKVGNDPRKDLKVIQEVRHEVGDSVKLRVDANQGYDVATAIRTIRKMEEYELEMVEQPVPGWDILGMSTVSEAVDTSIEADESVFSVYDAMNVIRLRAADVINIKIMKPGGLYPAKKLAALCEAAGITCLVGSMVEFGLGSLAGLHFAASTPAVQHASELVGPSLFQNDVLEEDLSEAAMVAGCITLPQGPGLGATLKTEYVDLLDAQASPTT